MEYPLVSLDSQKNGFHYGAGLNGVPSTSQVRAALLNNGNWGGTQIVPPIGQ